MPLSTDDLTKYLQSASGIRLNATDKMSMYEMTLTYVVGDLGSGYWGWDNHFYTKPVNVNYMKVLSPDNWCY